MSSSSVQLLNLSSLPDLDEVARSLVPLLSNIDKSLARKLAQRRSFLQQEPQEIDPVVMEERLMKLKPLLMHLKSLDSKKFGGLTTLVGAAQQTRGADELTILLAVVLEGLAVQRAVCVPEEHTDNERR